MSFARRGYLNFWRKENYIPLSELVSRFGPLDKAKLEVCPQVVSVAGRISRIREASSKLWFLDVIQGGSKAQIILNCLAFESSNQFEAAKSTTRRGDIIEASGQVTRTNTGELSLRATSLRVLAPCLVNIPDREMDIENRIRHRHLYMLASNQFSEIIRARSQLIGRLRTFLDTRGFVEVETPILAPNYGGANARPFITEHISDLPLYLRIAPELYLKQLVVGGLDRVYEIGKVFRNEGFDSTHNPEFTSCEFYQAYSNAEEMMRQVEDLMAELMSPNKALLDDFKSPFKRIEIVPFLEQRLGFEMPLSESNDRAKAILETILQNQGILMSRMNPLSLSQLYDKLIGHFIEPLCEKPTFITGHPVCMSPLAKPRSNKPFIADRFELFYCGKELANGFSELNDPELQQDAFVQQAIDLQAGDVEAQPPDEEFVNVLQAGLPPTAGCGIGIDRLVMFLCGEKHIRDILAFPMIRPKARDMQLDSVKTNMDETA